MLSLSELEHAARVLAAEWKGARLDKIVGPGDFELLLHLSGGEAREARDRLHLLLSWRPKFGRVSALARTRPAPPTPPAIVQFLRARMENARLREVEVRGGDRQLSLTFEVRDGTRTVLLLALMGPRSNLYVLEKNDELARSARPVSDTRRDLKLGEPYCDPEARDRKPSEDRYEAIADGDLLSAIELEYGPLEEQEQEDRLRHRLAQALKKQRASLERKERGLERDAKATEDSANFERWGELLKGHLKEVGSRAESIDVQDFETGEMVTIPLDPKLSPGDNLDLLFRRARKAMKKGVRAAQDMGALQDRLVGLKALDEALAAIEDHDEEGLAAFADQTEVVKLLDRYGPKTPRPGAAPTRAKKVWKIGKRELPTRLVPKRYRSTGGLEIWVGKNDEGNDVLTTRLARGKDLFFHLEGSPGSHVILRVEKGEPPQEALLEAAELAVQFSKQKNATRAPVHVAECKDITKPKGAKHGLVYVHRGRTIQLRRDPARLARVSEARIDD